MNLCWSNAYPVLVCLCEAKGEINLDELEISLNLAQIDILERVDFLIAKGLPLKYYKETNILKLEKKKDFVENFVKNLHKKAFEKAMNKLEEERK